MIRMERQTRLWQNTPDIHIISLKFYFFCGIHLENANICGYGISPSRGTVGVGSWAECGMCGVCSELVGCVLQHTVLKSFLFESARILPRAFPVVQLLNKYRPQSHSWALLDVFLSQCRLQNAVSICKWKILVVATNTFRLKLEPLTFKS